MLKRLRNRDQNSSLEQVITYLHSHKLITKQNNAKMSKLIREKLYKTYLTDHDENTNSNSNNNNNNLSDLKKPITRSNTNIEIKQTNSLRIQENKENCGLYKNKNLAKSAKSNIFL